MATWLILLIGILFTTIPLYGGNFNSDPDNYMRAVQVRDFISGQQSWFDTVQRRLDPPGGTEAFSRLVDLPLAGIALLAKPFMGLNVSVMVAAFVVPFILQLPLLFWLLAWAFRPLLGQASWALAPIAICYPGLIGEFMPGRIDHHSYQIMIFTLAMGATLRLLLADITTPPHVVRKCGLALGLGLALSLTIGVEGLLWLSALLGVVGYALWRSPLRLQPAAIAFAVSAPIAAALLLVSFRTHAQIVQPTLWIMSLVSVKLVLAPALVFALSAVVAPRIAHPIKRALAMAGIAVVISMLLLIDTPALLQGPWLGFDPWLVAYTSVRVGEMQPLARFDAIWPLAEALIFLALFGYWQVWGTTAPVKRPAIILLGATSALLGCLMLFLVARLDRFWCVVSLPGLFYALNWLLLQMRQMIKAKPKLIVCLSVLLAFTPLLILSWRGWAPLPVNVTQFAVPVEPFDNYDAILAANFLQFAYPSPQRILAYGTVGPELIWRTHHTVIGGGNYNNPKGIQTALCFFLSDDPRVAARVLHQAQINIIYIRDLPLTASIWSNQTDDSYNRPLHADNPNSMMQRLQRGENFPWLKKLDVPFNNRGKFTLYEIDKDALTDAAR